MEYKKLEEVNNNLETTDIKGKEYVEVNTRLKAFWSLWEEGKIKTDILVLENGMCVIKAEVFENKNDTEPRATGIAYEKEGSTFINKTSFIENCETSAIGRALGNAGIGINTAIASAEEVTNAIENQKKITAVMIDALKELIRTKNISTERVVEILNDYGYKKLADITMGDVTYIRNTLAKE